ncbi:hypothetical protein NN561_003521 [Cricetulus griseus]
MQTARQGRDCPGRGLRWGGARGPGSQGGGPFRAGPGGARGGPRPAAAPTRRGRGRRAVRGGGAARGRARRGREAAGGTARTPTEPPAPCFTNDPSRGVRGVRGERLGFCVVLVF